MYVSSLISESTVSHTSNLSGVVEQEEEIKHVEKEKEEEKEMTAKKDSYDLYKLNMSEVYSNLISSTISLTIYR